MKFWQSLSFTETEQLCDLARIAEEVGFHGVLASDHLFYPQRLESRYPYTPDGKPGFTPETPWPEPFAAIAAMAAVTRTLRFCTMVYVLPLRHPLEVAKATGTLAVLSGGRFVLGAGAGWMKEEFTALGEDFHTRGRRMDEMIEVLRKLWRGGMVEHRGRRYAFDRLQISPAPPGEIPIWIGGASDPALRRAAVLCDGWLGSGNDPAEVPAILKRLQQLRRDAGREAEPFEAVVPLTLPPDPDTLRALEDRGVTATVGYPLSYALGKPTSSLDEKRRVLEAYGNDVIAKLG